MENKTAVIEGRLDMRDLASCADFLILEKIAPFNKSDLLYKIVATFAKSAVEHHGVKQYTSTADALNHLQELGLGSMNRPKEGRASNALTLHKAIESEKGDTSEDYWTDLIKSGKVKMPDV